MSLKIFQLNIFARFRKFQTQKFDKKIFYCLKIMNEMLSHN